MARKPNIMLLRARYLNREFPACHTTDKIEINPKRGYFIEGICKVCGRKTWFRTDTIKTVKSCGCLSGVNGATIPDYLLEKSRLERYAGRVYGNLAFAGEVRKVRRSYEVKVRCTVCGCEHYTPERRWSKRRATRCMCNSERMKAEEIDRRYAKARWAIEHIWPDVVKAGRAAMEAHYG